MLVHIEIPVASGECCGLHMIFLQSSNDGFPGVSPAVPDWLGSHLSGRPCKGNLNKCSADEDGFAGGIRRCKNPITLI